MLTVVWDYVDVHSEKMESTMQRWCVCVCICVNACIGCPRMSKMPAPNQMFASFTYSFLQCTHDLAVDGHGTR